MIGVRVAAFVLMAAVLGLFSLSGATTATAAAPTANTSDTVSVTGSTLLPQSAPTPGIGVWAPDATTGDADRGMSVSRTPDQRTGPRLPDAPKAPVVPGTDDGGASSVKINVNGKPSTTVTLILALTVLSVAPSLLLLVTCFTKMIVVLSLTRNALGLATSPPNQVLTGLAMFLTLFVMAPVFGQINEVAIQPYLSGQFNAQAAYDHGIVPLREFLMSNTRDDELKLMIGLAQHDAPASPADVSMTTLIPAFVLSELKSAFIIALVVFIPFLVIDMLVAAALMSLGMMMVPPVIVSLPFKILLFVMVDGWALIATALVGSYT